MDMRSNLFQNLMSTKNADTIRNQDENPFEIDARFKKIIFQYRSTNAKIFQPQSVVENEWNVETRLEKKIAKYGQ